MDNLIDRYLNYIKSIEPILIRNAELIGNNIDFDLIEYQKRQHSQLLDKIPFDSIRQANKILEYHIKGDPTLKRDYDTINLLYDSGYWYIPSLPNPVFVQLLNLDDKSKENVSSLILELMNQNNCYQLEFIMDNWDLSFFKEKEIIFKNALSAHKDGKYVLSIPALALQVEPIVKKWLSLNPKEHMAQVKGELKSNIENLKEKKKNEIFIDEEKSRELFDYIVSLRFIDEVFFQFYGRQDFDDVNNTLNRHVIGHGALNIEDYNQELSTKLILFLDKLHFLLERFQNK